MTDADLSIIVPTIAGREEWLAKCLRGYGLTAPAAEVIVIYGEPSCGRAWEVGAARASRDYLHFTADDIIPAWNWWEAPMRWLDRGLVPAAKIVEPDRPHWLVAEVPLGLLGHPPNVSAPFLTRSMLDIPGGWFLPIHDGSDEWVTYRAAATGWPIALCPDYVLHHYLAPEGRNPARRAQDQRALIAAMEEAGYLPPYYYRLKEKLGA